MKDDLLSPTQAELKELERRGVCQDRIQVRAGGVAASSLLDCLYRSGQGCFAVLAPAELLFATSLQAHFVRYGVEVIVTHRLGYVWFCHGTSGRALSFHPLATPVAKS